MEPLTGTSASNPIPAARSVDISSSLIDHLDRVTVTVTSAAPGDWIGVYCLETDEDPLPLAVGDYLDRRDTSGSIANESIEFGPLVNMRCALQFQLLSSDNAIVATAPSRVRFRKGNAEPTQRHLAVTTKSTEMRIAWTSGNVTTNVPRVRYGRHAHTLDREAIAQAMSYDASDMCEAPATTRGPRAFRDPGIIYDATMVDLVPGIPYYYQVGSGSVGGDSWSDIQSFAMPPPSEDTTPQSFFVLGDLMAPTDATRDFRIAGSCGTTMELIAQELNQSNHQYGALVHVGDLSYAAGQTYVWDHFGAIIEPVAARLPYMVSIGNHDFGYLEGRSSKHLRAPSHPVFERDETKGFDAHGECGVPTEARFRMPTNGYGLYWYSFEMGLVHHTVLSAEHDFTVGSAMHEWLLRDLASVNRTTTPWLVVHLHRPLYCSVAFLGDYTRSLYLRDQLELVFVQFRVDVVFSGHYHSYERTCPVYDDLCRYGPQGEAQAPVHIMVGSGGANVDTFGYYNENWSEAAKLKYGYGRFHVMNASHAHFEFVQNDVAAVTDEAWIVSDHQWTAHTNWRWRRVVLHPRGDFLLTTAVLIVLIGAIAVIRKRLQRDISRRSSVHHTVKLR